MHRSTGRSVVLAVLLSCLVLTGSAGALADLGGADDRAADLADGQADAGATAGLLLSQHDETNETERHRNPEEYGEDGDLQGLESWLAGQLAERLGDGAIQLSQGEYDLARQFIGEEYRERFGQYVDVAGETEGESSEEELNETREKQEELTDLLEEYEETREAYEEALEAGNEERARELARKLVRLAAQLEAVSESLQELYEEIEALLGEDLTQAREAIAETTEEVRTEAAGILTAEFVETELRVDANREVISYADPLDATGRLSTVDGEPVANESILVSVGETSKRVETDAEGVFAFTYRPASVALDTSTLAVEYVPDEGAVYFGSETTIPVTIQQAEPRFEAVRGPAELAYAESGSVSGELFVENVTVDGVSLEVRLDGQLLETVAVTDGSFDGEVTMPASVAEGEQTLEVRLPGEGRALAGASATQVVTVRETETALSVNGTQEDDGGLSLTGTLRTIGGTGVGGQPVALRVDGNTVETVTTAENGEFAAAGALPDSVDAGSVRVEAVYEAVGTNLAPAEDETVVAVTRGGTDGGAGTDGGTDGSADGGGGPSGPGGVPLSVVGLLGFALALGLVAVWWLRRQVADDVPASDLPVAGRVVAAIAGERAGRDEEQPPDRSAGSDESEQTDDSPVKAVLDYAGDQLDAGQPDVAVQACYAAVRQHLAARVGAAEALTHWEFYRTYRESAGGEGEQSASETLRAVTEEYEHAAFSDQDTSADSAHRVFEWARRLCGVENGVEQTGTGSAGDD